MPMITRPANDRLAHFRAPGAMCDAIDAAADSEGLNFSQFVRRCLSQELDKRERLAAQRKIRAERSRERRGRQK